MSTSLSMLTLGRLDRGDSETLNMLTLGRLRSEGVTIKDGVYRGYQEKQIQEEDELLAMIAMAFIEMVE